jgi:thiosulfate dehydrogenase
MRNRAFTSTVILVLVSVAAAALLSVILSQFIDLGATRTIPTSLPRAPRGVVEAAGPGPLYNPPTPEQAPAGIREAVLLGAGILADTQKYAGTYVGNTLKCSNCHFNDGISQGGKNGGLSLVGVAATYPKYRGRQHAAVDLITRTNDCFERSMNGKPLPPDGPEMTAILTYYQWIAKGLPIYGEFPWLGLKPIPGAGAGDRSKGATVFASMCAPCHGTNGQGTPTAPALWGKGSYNGGAGMAKAETLAGFALLNMPRGNPTLSAEQAVDVAAYVDSQPRSRFVKK